MKLFRPSWIALPLFLAACSNSDVRESLGINKSAPDEFVVVSRPPLSVPPEFDLKPPRPGEAPRVPSTEDEARQALLGTSSPPASLDEAISPSSETAVAPMIAADVPTGASANFLKQAGVDKAEEGIREKLGNDAIVAQTPKKEADSLYEELVGTESEEPVVDAKKEAERLRANKDAQKPVTEGEVPTTKDKPKSLIDHIF